ncbi:uncharacterized protein [Palaemon carinicauda]|uniref:uncharacterized protein n=1 Tax=Palaemon carinicauda TaxID=392227 RepID=UPI0035B60C82
MRFLVDTGAFQSVLPKLLCRTRHSLSKSADSCLVAANRSAIPIYGYENITLLVGSTKCHWKFLVADVTLLIHGADFLLHYLFLVDVAHQQLVDTKSYSSTPLQPALLSTSAYTRIPMPTTSRCIQKFSIQKCLSSTIPAKHGNYDHIKMIGPSVFTRFRHLILDRLAATKQTFTKMEEMGLCQKSSSQWLSPLHTVLNKDGSLCTCGWGLQVSEHADRNRSLPTPKHRRHDLLPAKSKGFLDIRHPEGI